MRTKFELAEIVSLFGTGLVAASKPTPLQLKVLGKIEQCRTAALGGHEEACEDCGAMRYSYNSCGDRHCPKCQAAKQAFWIEDLIIKKLHPPETNAERFKRLTGFNPCICPVCKTGRLVVVRELPRI